MRVVFDAKAVEDLEGIHDWIALEAKFDKVSVGRRVARCL